MSRHTPESIELKIPADVRVAVVAARWNADIVETLLSGCVARLRALGVDEANLDVHRVPGAYELPVAARMCVKSTRFYKAVILIGCVIRGDTAHFEYVAGEAARGIQNVATDSGIPCLFGVLTVENHQQALDRAGGSHGHAGEAAAEAAAEMILLARKIQGLR